MVEECGQHRKQHQLDVVEAGGRLEVRAADVAVLLLHTHARQPVTNPPKAVKRGSQILQDDKGNTTV